MKLNPFPTIGAPKVVQGVFALLLCSLVFSCTKTPSAIKATPSIKFIAMSGDSMVAGSNEVINVKFTFRDGDGDLGVSPSSGNFDIYTIDSRDTTNINYFFPQALPSLSDPKEGLSGECILGIQAAFLAVRPSKPLGDTLHYEIYIKDRAGNESNHFTTPDIYLKPL